MIPLTERDVWLKHYLVSARMLAIEDEGRRSLVERMLIMSLTPAHNVKMIPGRRRVA